MVGLYASVLRAPFLLLLTLLMGMLMVASLGLLIVDELLWSGICWKPLEDRLVEERFDPGIGSWGRVNFDAIDARWLLMTMRG